MDIQVAKNAALFVSAIIVLVTLIFLVGFIAMKIYRIFAPLQQQTTEEAIFNNQSDSVFKTFFVGLIISSPALYYLFLNFF